MKRILISSMIMALSMPAFSVTKTVESISISGGTFGMGAPGSDQIIPADLNPIVMGTYQGSVPTAYATCGPSGTGDCTTDDYLPTSLGVFQFGFFGPVALYTAETDGVNSGMAAPSGTVDDAVDNSIQLDLSSWVAFWNGTSFAQGAGATAPWDTDNSDTNGVTDTVIPYITGTYNAGTRNFSVSWQKVIVGGAFDQQVGYWTLNGTVTLDNTAPVITLVNPDLSLVVDMTNSETYTEDGASAVDNMDGTVTVDISGTVDDTMPGIYQVTYTATDASNNTATIVRNVSVENGSAPVITVNPVAGGGTTVNVNEDTSYTDAGATATDAEDEDLTGSIVTTNPVDITQPGAYTVTYTVTDSDGNMGQATRTVNVLDTTSPIITLSGDSTLIFGLNDPDYADPGVSVSDNSGEILSAVVTGSVNLAVGGTYYLTYNAQDSAGNEAIPVVRTVIIDGIGPEIVLNDGPSVSINSGETFTDPGATATDDYGTSIVVESDCSAVDSSTAGIYSCIYTADDGFGNITQATLEVIVVDSNTPLAAKQPVLSATQGSQITSIVLSTAGEVTMATDLNSNQLATSTFDWSESDAAIQASSGSTGQTFTFDPAGLDDGIYSVRLVVNAGTADETTSEKLLRIISTAPSLSADFDTDGDGIPDAVEGYADSDNDGIPDFADHNGLAANQMTINASIMTVSQGTLRLGRTAINSSDLSTGTFSPEISSDDITNNNGEVDSSVVESCIGGCLDFEITNLTQGSIVNLVIPVDSDTIKSNGVYRKYTQNYGWQDFNTSGNDRIASAAMQNGSCPAANANNTWTEGLFPGDRCIRLTIQDGGLNDEDGSANGTIVDPSGVAQKPAASVNTVDGGCSMSGNANAKDHAEWLLVAGFIALLGWLKISRRKA